MRLPITAALTLAATPALALAHHPLGGLPMETFADGLLSGVGHPLLGFDHLFFVGAMVTGIGLFLALERIEAPLVAGLAG